MTLKKNKIIIKDEWVKGTAGHVKRVTKSTDYDEINNFEYVIKPHTIETSSIHTITHNMYTRLYTHCTYFTNGCMDE